MLILLRLVRLVRIVEVCEIKRVIEECMRKRDKYNKNRIEEE